MNLENIMQQFKKYKIKDNKKLKEYLVFCMEKNQQKEIKFKTVNHHLLPRKLFPEFSSFKNNKFNKIILTHSDHYRAHYLLSIAIDNADIYYSWWAMTNQDFKTQKISLEDIEFCAEEYEVLKKKAIEDMVQRTKGSITVKDMDGNYLRILADDPRYLSGELVGVRKNLVNVTEKGTGIKKEITKEEFLMNKHLYQHNTYEKVSVFDKRDKIKKQVTIEEFKKNKIYYLGVKALTPLKFVKCEFCGKNIDTSNIKMHQLSHKNKLIWVIDKQQTHIIKIDEFEYFTKKICDYDLIEGTGHYRKITINNNETTLKKAVTDLKKEKLKGHILCFDLKEKKYINILITEFDSEKHLKVI